MRGYGLTFQRTIRRSRTLGEDSIGARLLAFLAVAVAAVLRWIQCYEGLPYLHNWDEPQIAGRAIHMMQTGTFNPGFFNYGSVPIYLCLIVSVFHYLWLMGRPETTPPFLTNLDDVRTAFDSGWHWTISHPSFYLWDRRAFAAVGVAGVLLTYLIGRRLGGRLAGAIAASLLAVTAYHIHFSSIVGVDSLSLTLGLAAAYLSLKFHEQGKPVHLILALAAGGLAASTKYNAVLSLGAPLLAFILRFRKLEGRQRAILAAALVIVPPLAFFLGTPYALADLPRFLDNVGFEVHHYRVGGDWSSPDLGGRNLVDVQVRNLHGHLGIPVLAVALLGGLALVSRLESWIFLAYPALYVPFMAGSIPTHHRNFLVLYPVLSISFGMGIAGLAAYLRTRHEPREDPIPSGRRAPIAVGTLALAIVAWVAAPSFRGAREILTKPERRVVAADELAALVEESGLESPRVGIPVELRMHPTDLAKLKGEILERPYLELVCDRRPFDFVMAPETWTTWSPPLVRLVELLNATRVPGTVPARSIGNDAGLDLDSVQVNPAVRLYGRGEPSEPSAARCVSRIPAGDLLSAGGRMDPDGEKILLAPGAAAVTRPLVLGPGSYSIVLEAGANTRPRDAAELVFSWSLEGASQDDPGDRPVRHRLTRGRRPVLVNLDLNNDAAVSLRIEFKGMQASEFRPGPLRATLGPVHIFKRTSPARPDS